MSWTTKVVPLSLRSPAVRVVASRWIPGATVGLFLLFFPAIEALAGDYPGPAKILCVISLTLTGAAYQLVVPWAMFWPLSKQIWLIVAMVVVSLGLWPVAGANFVVVWIFSGVTAGALMSMRQTAVAAVLLMAGMLLAFLTDGQPANWELAGALLGLSFWMCAFMGNVRSPKNWRTPGRNLRSLR